MKQLFVIEGYPVILNPDGMVHWIAKGAIDGDGSGSSHGDPYFQDDTSLHYHGEALNADVDRYIVVPPQIISAVAPVVLGCQAIVIDTRNGNTTDAVVGDVGPKSKLGELSIACAKAIRIPSSPISGGIEWPVILYQIWPGKPATVGTKEYDLQPS